MHYCRYLSCHASYVDRMVFFNSLKSPCWYCRIDQPQPTFVPNMSPNLKANMRTTTDRFIEAWESWQVEPVMAVRAPECVMLQYPASLSIPARNNDDFRAWFRSVENMLSNCKVSDCPSSIAKLDDEFSGECFDDLSFTDDGTRLLCFD